MALEAFRSSEALTMGVELELQLVGTLDFDLAPREFVAVTGPSGSGKSSLMAMIGGLSRLFARFAYRNRLKFARRLHKNEDIQANALLYLELYPFHSKRVSATIDPDPDLLHRFVFGPLGEIDVAHIFGFGKPWIRVAERIGLGPGVRLQARWNTPSRVARSYRLPTGQDLIVLSQNGYAGPPGEADTATLCSILKI